MISLKDAISMVKKVKAHEEGYISILNEMCSMLLSQADIKKSKGKGDIGLLCTSLKKYEELQLIYNKWLADTKKYSLEIRVHVSMWNYAKKMGVIDAQNILFYAHKRSNMFEKHLLPECNSYCEYQDKFKNAMEVFSLSCDTLLYNIKLEKVIAKYLAESRKRSLYKDPKTAAQTFLKGTRELKSFCMNKNKFSEDEFVKLEGKKLQELSYNTLFTMEKVVLTLIDDCEEKPSKLKQKDTIELIDSYITIIKDLKSKKEIGTRARAKANSLLGMIYFKLKGKLCVAYAYFINAIRCCATRAIKHHSNLIKKTDYCVDASEAILKINKIYSSSEKGKVELFNPSLNEYVVVLKEKLKFIIEEEFINKNKGGLFSEVWKLILSDTPQNPTIFSALEIDVSGVLNDNKKNINRFSGC